MDALEKDQATVADLIRRRGLKWILEEAETNPVSDPRTRDLATDARDVEALRDDVSEQSARAVEAEDDFWETARELTSSRQALRKYATHHSDCRVAMGEGDDCSCGLAEVRL